MGLFDSINWGDLANVGAQLYSANQLGNAASSNANAMNNATQQAVQAAQFKPYSITTGFGASAFDPNTQRATYALNPVLQAFRNKQYSLAGAAYDQLGNLDPTAKAQQLYAQQQSLMAPQRTQEDIALRNQQLGSGRIGLGLSSEAAGGGAGGYLNPEQFNLNRARSMADAQMAYNTQQQAQANIDQGIARASGLMQGGFGVEQQGLTPLTLGSDIGKTGVAAGSSIANSMLQGAGQMALANSQNAMNRANMYSSLGSAFGGMFSR